MACWDISGRRSSSRLHTCWAAKGRSGLRQLHLICISRRPAKADEFYLDGRERSAERADEYVEARVPRPQSSIPPVASRHDSRVKPTQVKALERDHSPGVPAWCAKSGSDARRICCWPLIGQLHHNRARSALPRAARGLRPLWFEERPCLPKWPEQRLWWARRHEHSIGTRREGSPPKIEVANACWRRGAGQHPAAGGMKPGPAWRFARKPKKVAALRFLSFTTPQIAPHLYCGPGVGPRTFK